MLSKENNCYINIILISLLSHIYHYIFTSAVLNMGWCHKVNSLKTHQLLHEGDYHTTDSDHQFTVTNTTTSAVQKDLVTEIVTLSDIGRQLCTLYLEVGF